MTRRPLHPFVFEPPPVSDEPDELYEFDAPDASPWSIVILPFAQLAMYAAYFAAVPVMFALVAMPYAWERLGRVVSRLASDP